MANLHKEAEDGRRATELLENETFREAMAKVRQGIFDAWEKAPVRDMDGQHELKLMLKLLVDLEKHIATVAQTGKLASIQINEEKEKESRISRIVKGFRS